MPAAVEEGEWKSASWKQEEDHSKATAELLDKVNAATAKTLVATTEGGLDGIINLLLALEKKARLGGDSASTEKLATEVVKICLALNTSLDVLMSYVDLLMKRRAQMKPVQSAIIKETSAILTDSLPLDERVTVLQRLRTVTEGRLHVELEYARFSVELATIFENRGELKEASELLQSIQVETITNMPRLEKMEVLLTQIRLCMETDDYTRAAIMARKINCRALAKPDTKDVKLRYFRLMYRYYEHSESHFHMALCQHELYTTLASEDEKLTALSAEVMLLLIAEHSSEKALEDSAECAAFAPPVRLDRTKWITELCTENKQLRDELPVLFALTKQFAGVELLQGALGADVQEMVTNHPAMAGFATRQQAFKDRVSEHDILVVSKYYTRVPIARLATLVGLDADTTEKFIMNMVTGKMVYAKVDRIDGIVDFRRKANADALVQEWNGSVQRVVELINHSAHLITKERITHGLQASKKASK